MVVPFSPDERNASDNPWIVFDYEIQMYFETRNLLKHLKLKPLNNPVNIINKNAVVESKILHTRILTDILISKGSQDDDIMLVDLLPEWCNSEVGEALITKLKDAYGSNKKINSPCWVINKMLAHPTKLRTDKFDYSSPLRQIEPIIFELLSRIESVINRPILSYYLLGLRSNTNP